MKNYHICFSIIILLCLINPTTKGQKPNYTLQTDNSATDKTYLARDYIVLKNGFKFSAANANKKFKASIDAGLLFPPTQNTYALPNGNITTDSILGAVVGSIPGQFAVSPTGAATYQIPIEIPTGINGIQPNVSLAYNSQGGNGIAGWGWTLGGLSSISRTGSTLYHDSKTVAPQLTTADNLIFDGQRLLLISGTNLTEGAKYRTEIETYSDITYKTINGSLSFEVKTKAGLILEYGSTTDSYIEAQGSNIAINWVLTKVTDANGNYMTYSYGEDNTNGEFWLDKIKYTYNVAGGVTTAANEIEFKYNVETSRSDKQSGYFAGKKVSQTKRIDYIYTKTNGQTLRTYHFEYSYDGFYTKLDKIYIEGKDGIKLNPTIINWDGQDEYSKYGSEDFASNSPNREGRPMYADFNGDGKTDYISYPIKSTYTSSDVATLYLNTYNYGISFLKKCTIPLVANFKGIILADLNGDDFMDAIVESLAPNGTFRYNFYMFNGTNFTYNYYGFNSAYQDIIVGDYNGDGKYEVLVKGDQKLYNEYGTQIAVGGIADWGTKLIDCFPNNCYLTDFNGNGKTDICILNGSGCKVYELNNSSFSEITTFQSSLLKNSDGIMIGEFNGDGKTDILIQRIDYSYPDNNHYYFHYSTGNSFVQSELPNLGLFSKTYVADFNKDGLSDIVHVYSQNNIFYSRIGINKATGFDFSTHAASYFSGSTVPDWTYLNYSDFDGDGRAELCFDRYVDKSILQSFDDTQNLLVKGITDGLDKNISLEYSPITSAGNYSETVSAYTYPVSKKQFPLYVVSTVNTDNSSLYYTYKNSRIHRQGKGFLGFGEVAVTDFTNNTLSTTQYGYNTSFFNIYPLQQTVATRSGLPVSTSSITNAVVQLGGKRIMPYVSTESITDNLTGLSVTTATSNIDSYGNPQTIITTKGGIVETKTISYIQKGSWCKNKVESLNISKVSENKTDTRTTQYVYDDTTGDLNKETKDAADENAMVTEYKDFDSFGHPCTVEISANGKTRTSKVTHKPSGRFIATKTNELLQTTTYDWDETRGLLNAETDYRYNSTTYKNDNWGQAVEIKYPTGIRKAQVLQWATAEDPSGAKYYSYSETSGSAPIIQWYDGRGREIRKDSYGLNGKKVSVSTEYYPNNKIYRVSDPYFEADAGSKTWAKTYTYDAFGRPLTLTTPMGVSSTAYTGKTTTVTTPEGTNETTVNNAGQVVSSKVNGKTVSHTYYPSGLVQSSTPDGGQAVSVEYDLQGKRTKLIDPDGGTVESKYNGFGDLLWQRQKIHNNTDYITTTNTYDDAGLGLLQNINRNGEVTTYTYDPTYKSRVNAIEISGKNKQVFTFDTFDRVTNVKETIDTRIYNTSKSYDALGRIKKETYPSGYYTVNTYDQYSNLTEVKDYAGRSIWKVNAENARGQLTSINRGAKETTFGFDSRGLPTSIVASGVEDMSYSFDTKGNLSYRTDNLTKQNEQFTYDSMNRLTNWNVYQNGVLAKQNGHNYDATTGNITTRTDLDSCTMTYGGKRSDGTDIGPHALTSISGVPSVFPTADLTITYNDFKKIATLTEGNKYYELTYGTDDQRRKSVYKENGVIKETRYYLGNYEEKINNTTGITEKIHYLSGAIYIERSNGTNNFYYTYADYQGSLLALTNESGSVVERYAYDPWGARRNPDDWTQKDNRTTWIVNRGYTGHEHLDAFSIINMNGRVYDPATAMFMSPDPYIQSPENWLNYNRYGYCINNPFKYTDPSGEFFWMPILIGAAIFGTGNLVAHAIKGDVNNFWDGLKYFGQGALVGAALGAAWQFAPLIPWAGQAIQTGMTWYAYGQAGIGVLGTITGAFNDGWKGVGNGAKLFLGNFYLDENNFLGGVWQGFSRHTWESLNSFVGHTYSQIRNTLGLTDHVKYFGGATFSIRENVTEFNGWSGVSIGNYINAKIPNEFDENYPNGWINGANGLYWHEYGHTFDSRIFGFLYLPVVGISSAATQGWTENRANRWANRYGKRYGYWNDWPYNKRRFPL